MMVQNILLTLKGGQTFAVPRDGKLYEFFLVYREAVVNSKSIPYWSIVQARSAQDKLKVRVRKMTLKEKIQGFLLRFAIRKASFFS